MRPSPPYPLPLDGSREPGRGWRGDCFASWVDSRELLYHSKDARGARRLYSARVYLPTASWFRKPRAVPVLVYIHASQALVDQVPQFNRGAEAMLGAMAAYFHNFAVAMPDLPGYGKDPSPRPHPFCHAKSLAFSVLDLIRPTLQLLKAEQIDWDGRIFLVGYSAGGYAAMAAVKEWHSNPRYAELPLTAAACMAGPFQFAESLRSYHLDGLQPPRPDIEAFLINAYHDLYPEAGVFAPGQAFNPRLLEFKDDGADQGNIHEWLRGGYDESHIQQKIKYRLAGSGAGLAVAEGTFNPDWVAAQLLSKAWPDTAAGRILKENDLVGGWCPRVPMFLATSPSDECVSPSNTHAIMEDWARQGCTSEVTLCPLTILGIGLDHLTGGALALHRAVRWLKAHS